MRARIRSIKPELLQDEDLWDLGEEFPDLHILQSFEGLWMFADKEGRFEWRPRALGSAILPYWGGDFSRVLDALTTRGFIVRYEVDGREYGAVRTFRKHQAINNRETESEIPPPPKEALRKPTPSTTRQARVDDASGTRERSAPAEGNGKGTGKEGNGNPTRACPREGAAPPVGEYVPLPVGQNPAEPEREPGEPEPPERTVTTAAGDFEMHESFRAEYDAAEAGTMPTLTIGQRSNALAHCRAVQRKHGKSDFAQVARDVCRAAVPGSKDWVFALARADPYASPRAPPARAANGNGRMRMAPATTHEDFADAEPMEKQLARLRGA